MKPAFASPPALRSIPRVSFLALPLLAWVLVLPASAQQSHNVTLLSQMNLYGQYQYSSCWSYVHSDGREYAVELAQTGASIVRLTDPTHPVEVAFIGLRTSQWHEARQYRNWIYITTEVFNGVPSGNGLDIVSMVDPDHPKVVGSFHPNLDWAHTLTIDTDRGILYAAGGPNGMAIYSLADPEQPVQIGLYPGTPFTQHYIHTFYTHGNRGYASEIYDGKEAILDMTDPANPVELASFSTPGHLTHSSWTSDDQRYLYVTDEINGPRLGVYDIQDLSNVRRVYQFEELSTRTTPHDPVIRGNLAFVSYYTAGAHFLDVRNPAWPVDVGYYDTFPGRDGGLFGCWEAAPMFPSGIFIASDIETGLYVLRPNLNYAIVRGTVTQAPSGPILPGVTINQSGSAAATHSYSDGRYAIAVDPGSAVTLQTSMFAFNPLTKTVSAPAGSDQTLDLKVVPSDAGSLAGTVRRSSDQSALNEGEIQVLGTPLSALSDANGAYSIASVPVGSYLVRCARAGLAPKTTSVTVTKNHTSTIGFNLASSVFYDDAETDRGWTLGAPDDDATAGLWIRDVPLGTLWQPTGEIGQTDKDHTPAPGTKCFVTGNGTNPNFIAQQSVHGGKTTLTSPVLHMAGVSDPRVGFWRWYVNFVADAPWDDPFVTQLSSNGGQTWTSIDSLYFSVPGWNYVEIPISNYIPNPGDVLVRFIAEDQGEFSIVEAAIDDVSLYSGAGTGPSLAASLAGETPTSAALGRPYPSPTKRGATMELLLARETDVRAEIYDVQGRIVRTLQHGSLPAGVQMLRWDGMTQDGSKAAAGVYWLRVNAAGTTKSSKLVVIR